MSPLILGTSPMDVVGSGHKSTPYLYICNPVMWSYGWSAHCWAKRIGPLDKAGRASVAIRVLVYSSIGQWCRFSALFAITQTTFNINGYYYLYKLSIIVKLEWNLTKQGGVGVKESIFSKGHVLGYSALLAYILHPRESAGALDSSWGAR